MKNRDSIQAILDELEQRDKAKTSLADYSRYMLELNPAAHHILICDHIDRLLNDEYDELIILAPPGSAKSTYTSVALPSYFLGKFPTGQVLTASYSSDLSEKWGRRVRNIVDSAKFNNLFEVQLSKDSTAASRWATAQGGELYAAGVLSGILGFRADLAIIDDPISGFEEANSVTRLKKVHDWYETDLLTRMKPEGKLVLICQRLARHDLAGYLIDRNVLVETRRQKILRLPMLPYVHEKNEDGKTPPGVKLGELREPDPLGRKPGERLWPEWYTDHMVKDAQRDNFKWKTLYQQEPPSDEGEWVTTEEIQFRPTPERGAGPTYAMTDLALSINKGDTTFHLVVQIDLVGDWDVIYGHFSRVDVEKSARKVVDICDEYSPKEWLIDDDNSAKSFLPLLMSKALEERVTVPVKVMPMRGQDKETKNAPLRGMFKRRKIYLPPTKEPWVAKLVEHVLSFPNAMGDGVDDGVDALGLLGRRLLSLAYAKPKKKPKPTLTVQQMTLNHLFEDMSNLRNDRI